MEEINPFGAQSLREDPVLPAELWRDPSTHAPPILADSGVWRQMPLAWHMGYVPLELDPLVLPLVEGRTVLDLGCGYGHWGHLLRTQYYSEDRSRTARITGVDIRDGNVVFCGAIGVYDEIEDHLLDITITSR